MHVSGYSWAGIPTDDFSASVAFFEDVIGLKLEVRANKSDFAKFVPPSGQFFEIFGPKSDEVRIQNHRPTVGFNVDAVHPAHDEMEARAVEFVTEIEHSPMAGGNEWTYFRGPDGIIYQICREVSTRKGGSTGIDVQGFTWAGVKTDDYANTVDFFNMFFGLPPLERDDAATRARWALPSGQHFEVFGPKKTKPQHELMTDKGVCLGFSVSDLAAAVSHLQARKVELVTGIESTDAGESWAYFLGPDGHLFTLVQA